MIKYLFCLDSTTGMVKFNLPVFERIGGMSASLDSLDKNMNPLFMHSPAGFMYPYIDPRGGKKGSYLNSKIRSNIDLVLLAEAKLAQSTPINRAKRLVVYPVSSKKIMAGEMVLVAPPNNETAPITPNSP